MSGTSLPELGMTDLAACFSGVIPVVMATLSADGIPNVTYLSRVLPVDADRIAVSNQFMSKSRRNLSEVTSACMLLIRPDTHDEFRVWLTFEQTVRRGEIFDRLRNELSVVAALSGMQDVFKLRAADVFRVEHVERVQPEPHPPAEPATMFRADHASLGELCARISRCTDLDALVRVLLGGLDELLGFSHTMLLLVDESGEHLFALGSHGYDHSGTGAEIEIGHGIAGQAASRCAPVVLQNVSQMSRYARVVRSGFEQSGELTGAFEVPMPGLATPQSQAAVPALALGELVGVILAESLTSDRFSESDVASLTIVASLVASAIERLRSEAREATATPAQRTATVSVASDRPVSVRHFRSDGSTFVDGEYLIKGVAGKLFWSLVRQYLDVGRTDFTNREMRLDRSLELPDFRDNFESRLILLKRRLDDRDDPVRIHRTGRGRFRLTVDRPIVTELVD